MFLLANLRARAAPSAPAFHTCAGTVNSLGRLTTARWFDWRLTGRAWNLTNANTWSTDQLTSGKSPPVILRTSWKGRGEGCRINTVLMTLISTYGYQCRLRSLLSSSNQQPSDHTPLVLTLLLYNYVLLSSLTCHWPHSSGPDVATVQLRAAVISDLSLTTLLWSWRCYCTTTCCCHLRPVTDYEAQSTRLRLQPVAGFTAPTTCRRLQYATSRLIAPSATVSTPVPPWTGIQFMCGVYTVHNWQLTWKTEHGQTTQSQLSSDHHEGREVDFPA